MYTLYLDVSTQVLILLCLPPIVRMRLVGERLAVFGRAVEVVCGQMLVPDVGRISWVQP